MKQSNARWYNVELERNRAELFCFVLRHIMKVPVEKSEAGGLVHVELYAEQDRCAEIESLLGKVVEYVTV